MHAWTPEQLTLFNLMEEAVINKIEPTLIKCIAVAGSSKSTSMEEATKRIYDIKPDLKARYLVFNTANADEAKLAFGRTAQASTLHSLAHFYTVKPYKLGPVAQSFLTWQDIPTDIKIPFGHTPDVLNEIDRYCNSGYTKFKDYMLAELLEDPKSPWYDPRMLIATDKTLDAMASGRMRITHAFYLKLFHILVLSNPSMLPEMDLLIVDEAQDLTPITFDIFDKYPAKVKVLVGDPAQAIYGFMGCISAFDKYKNKGITATLSSSFRVASHIAKSIQLFCNTTFDLDMVFKGMDYKNPIPLNTHAYLTRTNAELIAHMIECNKTNIPYKLATKAKIKQMFALPLMLIYATPGKKQYTPELQTIQNVVDEWGKQNTDMTKLAYVMKKLDGIEPVQQAAKLILQHGSDAIIEAEAKAEKHKTSNATYFIMTVHTSKGLTMDEVTLADDVNEAIEDAIVTVESGKPISEQERDELFLYYVACSRCRYKLNNAKHLPYFDNGLLECKPNQ